MWSVAYETIIPKIPTPTEPGHCRNISCTNLLSKVYESFLLEWARKFVNPSMNQFGGEKRCGAEHMLIDAWDYVTSSLEDNRSAAILTTLDYSKAFNRLGHAPCLRAFAAKGAPNQILGLLACFLSGRSMVVRVGAESAEPRQINSGAPQGSVLGSYLFCVGIDDLDKNIEYPSPTAGDPVEHSTHTGDYPTMSTPRRVRSDNNDDIGLSPIRGADRFELIPSIRVVNAPPWIRRPKDPNWKDPKPKNDKFIDDGLHMEAICVKEHKTFVSGGRCVKIIEPQRSQAFLDTVTTRAAAKGMKVNSDKQRSCVSLQAAHLRPKSS